MSHLVRKAVTFGKEQPVREKLNCFSLSACCSKFLLALPVIWREKCGACSVIGECEGGWVDASQPLFWCELKNQRLGRFRIAHQVTLEETANTSEERKLVNAGSWWALFQRQKPIFLWFDISLTLYIFCGQNNFILFTKAEFVIRLVISNRV